MGKNLNKFLPPKQDTEMDDKHIGSMSILVCLSVPIIKHLPKLSQGEKHLFHLTGYSPHLGKSQQGPRDRT